MPHRKWNEAPLNRDTAPHYPTIDTSRDAGVGLHFPPALLRTRRLIPLLRRERIHAGRNIYSWPNYDNRTVVINNDDCKNIKYILLSIDI